MSQTIDTSTDARDKAMSHINAGRALNVKGEFAAAVAQYVQALIILQEIGDFSMAAQTFIQVGNVYMNQSEFSEAYNVFRDALSLSISIDDKPTMCRCYNSMGNAKGSMSDYDPAIENYEAGLKIAIAMGDTKSIGTFHSNLGGIDEYRGNYTKCLEHYLISLRIMTELGDKNILQMVHNNLSNIYSKLKNYNEALIHAETARQISADTGNRFIHSHANITCAQTYFLLGDADKALSHFKVALDIKIAIGDKNGAAVTHNGIGHILLSQDDAESALDHHLKALALYKEIEVKSGMASSYNDIANAYMQLGNHEAANENLQIALSIGTDLGHKENKSTALLGLYKLNKILGDSAAALSYYERHIEAASELQNIETSMQMANLKTSYDLEIKDKEKQAIERVLHNILPASIAERIRNGEEKIIERFPDVSVLFADMVGFTTWSHDKRVDEVAALLDKLFAMFDELTHRYGVEKIKTIGDSYMCVAGLPAPCADHAERIAMMALAMEQRMREEYPGGEIRIRIGIHCGEVIAGIIGRNKYAYDLWGDTVNTASRMESHGVADRIQISEEYKNLVGDHYEFEERGEIFIKGKSKRTTYFLLGTKAS